eukprot:1154228-Pelagomonas_calceolata.AAC.1
MTSKLSGCLCAFSKSCADPPSETSETVRIRLGRVSRACRSRSRWASSDTPELDVPAEDDAQGLRSGNFFIHLSISEPSWASM